MEKPKPNYLNIILICLAFILFLTSAYYLGKQSVKPTVTPVTVLPKTTAVPTSIVDPTANWKTYTNTVSNFEFSYPNDWLNRITSTSRGDELYMTSPSKSLLRIYTITDDSKTIVEFLSKRDKESSTGWEGQPSTTVISTKKTVISNLSCIQRQETYNAAGFNVYSTYFKNGNTFYQLTLEPQEGVLNSKDINLYQQILSTFKFTESKAEVNIEKQIGYIKKVYSKNVNNYLTIDYVQWQNCSTCPNGYKVINDNTQLRDIQLSSSIDINLIYITQTSKKVSVSELTKLIGNPTPEYPTDKVLYWITFDKSGNISQIDEQYQP